MLTLCGSWGSELMASRQNEASPQSPQGPVFTWGQKGLRAKDTTELATFPKTHTIAILKVDDDFSLTDSQEIYLLNSRKVHNNFHNKNIHNKTLLALLTHGQLWIFTSTQLRCGSTFLIEKKYCISNAFQQTNWPFVVFQYNREWVFVAGFQVTLNWTLKVIVSSKGNYVMPQK